MPTKVEIRLDRAGIGQILRSSAMAALMRSTAEQVATAVRSQQRGSAVVVHSYTTDRAASSVTVADPRATGWQARDGLLTRAAASVGLEVASRP